MMTSAIMPATCSSCHQLSHRYKTTFYSTGPVDTCFTCDNPIHSIPQCVNPYSEMVIDHVLDDEGKPLRITSARQLREAEKRYKFRSLVGHTNECDFDKPPQGEKRSLAEIMFDEGKFLYPDVAKSMLKEMERNGELMPVAGRR